MRYADITFGFDEADGEAAQPGDVLGAMSCANAATVFVVVPVNDVMATIFYTPMLAVRLKDFFGIGFFRIAAGHSVNDLVHPFSFQCFLVQSRRLGRHGENSGTG